MTKARYKILAVDDDRLVGKQLRRLFQQHADEFPAHDIVLELKAKLKTAIEAIKTADPPYDLIILDWRLSAEGNGGSLLAWLKDEGRDIDTDVIMFTGHGSDATIFEQSLELGAYAYADKHAVLHTSTCETDEDIQIFERRRREFLFQIKNSIERVRIRRRRRLTIDLIGQMHQRLSGSLDYDDQLNAVVELPHKVNGDIQKTTVRVPSPDRRSLIRAAMFCSDRAGTVSKSAEPVKKGEGLVWRAFTRGELVCCNTRLREEQGYCETWPDARSELVIPLKDGDATIAVLNMESDVENCFQPDDRRAMNMLAEIASLSLRDAFRFVRVMQSVIDINQAMHGKGTGGVDNADYSECFELILGEALRLTDADLGVIFQVDRNKEALVLVHEKGMGPNSKQEAMEIPFDSSRFVAAHVVREGTAARTTGDPEKDKKWQDVYMPILDERIPNEGTNVAFLCVPIKAGDKVLGAIDVETRKLDSFSYLKQRVVEAFASTAASALATELQSKERVDAEVDRERHRARAEFLSLVAHRLKSPVNAVRNMAYLCERILEKNELDALGECVRGMVQAADAAAGTVQQGIDTARRAASNIDYARVDICDMLLDLIDELKENWPSYIVELSGFSASDDNRETTHAHPQTVRHIMEELIGNAVTMAGGYGKTVISYSPSEEFVDLLFADDGPGVPEEVGGNLFLPGISSRDSTGVGLSQARYNAEIMGGSLTLESSVKSQGATFKLRLPGA